MRRSTARQPVASTVLDMWSVDVFHCVLSVGLYSASEEKSEKGRRYPRKRHGCRSKSYSKLKTKKTRSTLHQSIIDVITTSSLIYVTNNIIILIVLL